MIQKKTFAIIVLKTLVGESCHSMAGRLTAHPDVCRMLEMLGHSEREYVLVGRTRIWISWVYRD